MGEPKWSVNERAEKLLGRRLSKEDEERGVVAIDMPCELGYWCPSCKKHMDEGLHWSEYRSMLWCERCNFDWPSALCVPINSEPDPSRPWFNAGRDAAVRVFLDTIGDALNRPPPPALGEAARET